MTLQLISIFSKVDKSFIKYSIIKLRFQTLPFLIDFHFFQKLQDKLLFCQKLAKNSKNACKVIFVFKIFKKVQKKFKKFKKFQKSPKKFKKVQKSSKKFKKFKKVQKSFKSSKKFKKFKKVQKSSLRWLGRLGKLNVPRTRRRV